MKLLVTAVLALTAAGANAQVPTPDYPSYDLPTQRALGGGTGGSITDPSPAHEAARADVLTADIGKARKADRLNQADADALAARVAVVRSDTDRYGRWSRTCRV